MNRKPILAETLIIEQEPKQVGDYTYQYACSFVCETAKHWENFMIDNMYKIYKKLGVPKVLLICEDDFERYIRETLPDWIKKEREKL